MSEMVRLFRYRGLLTSRRCISGADLRAQLEISPATFKRDLAKLRDQMHVPIEFDRDAGGYRLAQNHDGTELPGLWFSQDEILALVTIQQLLEQLEPGLLGSKLRPFKERLSQLMEVHGLNNQDVARRIRILSAGKRKVSAKSFEVVAAATLARRRLRISHFNRQNGKTLEREVSPQRLVHYRDNWYMDAWCHLREELRSFSIDAIPRCEVLEQAAKEIADKRIDEAVGAGYGIFNGAATALATLRFTPERARWVARESWHPQQESSTEADGSYLLTFPYSDDRELIGDIMRFGADVQVVSPPELRSKVQKGFLAAAARYV